jgi:hypothetical protein
MKGLGKFFGVMNVAYDSSITTLHYIGCMYGWMAHFKIFKNTPHIIYFILLN